MCPTHQWNSQGKVPLCTTFLPTNAFCANRISVASQAYLDVSAAANPALSYGAAGIVGLGFTSLSTVDALVNHTGGATGRSLLYNAFADNKAEPNYIAFSLQRSAQPNDDVEGTFSIGQAPFVGCWVKC